MLPVINLPLIGYGAVTAAGQGASALFAGLLSGKDFSEPAVMTRWPVTAPLVPRLCLATRGSSETTTTSQKERMTSNLCTAFAEAVASSTLAASAFKNKEEKWGVIFASTKGCIEDYVWLPDGAHEASFTGDTLTPVLQAFLKRTFRESNQLALTTCISNACSSTHAAVYLAREWLQERRVAYVLVLAADAPGPFVANGFAALKSLASKRVQPFAKGRDGIQLGEAAIALLFSHPDQDECKAFPCVTGVALENEGFALTRSDDRGESLLSVCKQVCEEGPPTLILAHATGTPTNDAVEDFVYSKLFGNQVPITCTKWSIGHCLGASGGVDLIVACEILKHQKAFTIANTEELDEACKASYLLSPKDSTEQDLSLKSKISNSILITSLGFGGVHAAISLTPALNIGQRREEEGRQVAVKMPLKIEMSRPALHQKTMTFTISYQNKAPPPWAKSVPRWSQLDPMSYGFCDAAARLLNVLPLNKATPTLMILANASASFSADSEFVKSGAYSPSKFVYTLPSAPLSALLQILNWRGPVLCFQNSNDTWNTALTEARHMVERCRNAKIKKTIWIWHAQQSGNASVTVDFCLVTQDESKGETSIGYDI
jgi:3-oxoacyl-(acyl-carrier-protein) synthase